MRTAVLIAIIAISVGAQSAYAAGDVTKLQIGVKVRVLMCLITKNCSGVYINDDV